VKIEIAPRTLVGIIERGPSSFNDSENSGAAFAARMWEKFIPMVMEQGLSLNREMYGVSWPADEKTPPQEIHLFVGCEKPEQELSADFVELKLDGGAYFEYSYSGSPKDIDRGFLAAYTQAFPASGLKSREGQHLEVFPDDYDPTAEVISFKILIPVQ
jgi:predicted transcriptional regulator YdeE